MGATRATLLFPGHVSAVMLLEPGTWHDKCVVIRNKRVVVEMEGMEHFFLWAWRTVFVAVSHSFTFRPLSRDIESCLFDGCFGQRHGPAMP